MNLTLETSVSAFVVFFQGLFSFFSPCILPLVPMYIGYLAGGTLSIQKDGQAVFPRKKVFINTIFFVLGVSFTFFALGFGFTSLGQFFTGNRKLFAQIGGILVILFGLYQLGVFGGGFLGREHRLSLKFQQWSMNPLIALVFGFTFSFAWTPCVGPALTSVLLLASSSEKTSYGYLLIGIYTLGFILPFLGVGIFAERLLGLFKRHKNVVRYTVKAGGVLMILMGFMMFTGLMNNVTGYLSQFGSNQTKQEEPLTETPSTEAETQTETSEKKENTLSPSYDFTLTDQYGVSHTLSDYKGKTVLLNFWATWCGYCKEEMPDLQAIYEEYGKNEKDVIILGIAAPDAGDVSEEEIKSFLDEEGFSYPTLMDYSSDIFQAYGATALPTTFMIDKNGNVFGYVSGMLSKSQMQSIIQKTMESL